MYDRTVSDETPKGSVIYGPDGAEISVGGAISTSSVEAEEDVPESQKPLDVDGTYIGTFYTYFNTWQIILPYIC